MLSITAINATAPVKERIPGIKLGMLQIKDIIVEKSSPHWQESYTSLENFIKEKFKDQAPSADNVVSAVRGMYRRIGLEPTRYRPSSEAMIRRILRDKGLYNVNNIVDLGNIASARFHLPMGLYDVQKIEGGVLLDVGQENESYRGISQSEIHAHGKMVLRDERGVFGNPTADSERTSISMQTTMVLAVFFTPPAVDDSYLQQVLEYLKDLYRMECDSSSIEIKIALP